jgi:hypothetical protein
MIRGRRLLAASILALGALCLGASTATANLEFSQAGVQLTGADGAFSRQAGAHPDFDFSFAFPAVETMRDGLPVTGPPEAMKDVVLDLPVGMYANPKALPACSPAAFLNGVQNFPACPVDSQIGVVTVDLKGSFGEGVHEVALYNLVHGPEVPARFGFRYYTAAVTISAAVRPGDYGITSGSFNSSQANAIQAAKVHLWGVPADPSHDTERQQFEYFEIFGNPITTEAPRVPFFTNPGSCPAATQVFTARGDSWEQPGIFDTRLLAADEDGTPFAWEGCEDLSFAPTLSAQPTTRAPQTPTGLSVDFKVPQNEAPDGLATANVRRAVVSLPQGMAVSSASANGLGACGEAEVGIGSNDPPTCPDSSKIGSVSIKTPLLEEELEGGVYLAKQRENPFGSLLALYLIVKGPGFYLKLPGKVAADPQTGQLTVSFDDTPQLPFEELRMVLKAGPRAPLTTPSACGTYAVQTEITPWSGTPAVKGESKFTIDDGCAVGGFAPGLRAGTANSTGGSFSPFNLQVTRADGETNLSRIQATLPEGLLAKLAGVPLCGESQVATGNCPGGSLVGTTTVGAGSGPTPIYVPEPGKAPTGVYLAGPYKGAPYSLVVKVPAQAGPFDLGTVFVRNGLRIDPTTTQVTAESDPLPQILEGIPISYRDVRVEVTRPEFTINPTNCRQMAVTSVLTSATGQTADPSARFQATGCGELGFKPSLALRLKGQTKRLGHPALSAVLKAPKGEANIAKTAVILPKSEFIDNAHINNPCTRVQFNASACPESSILGTATAHSPLLDKPLSGPVYFRSNGGDRELPDLVADLDGQIHVTLVGFIDSVKKKGSDSSRVRTRFQSVPDAPVSKFVLKLKGGKRGLIENSQNLCKSKPKATVKMEGQNGKPDDFEQKISVQCPKGKGDGKKKS